MKERYFFCLFIHFSFQKGMFNVHLNHHYYRIARKKFWKRNKRKLKMKKWMGMTWIKIFLLCVRLWRRKEEIDFINFSSHEYQCCWSSLVHLRFKKKFRIALLYFYNFISDYFDLCFLKDTRWAHLEYFAHTVAKWDYWKSIKIY